MQRTNFEYGSPYLTIHHIIIIIFFIISHHDLEVVAGNDGLSVLHPADGGLRVSRHGTLHLDVRAFIRIRVRRIVEETAAALRTERERNTINIITDTHLHQRLHQTLRNQL